MDIFNILTIRHLILSSLLILIFNSASAKDTDVEKIRERIFEELLSAGVDDVRVEKLIKSQKPDGSWPGINYEDLSRTGFENRYHTANLLLLARAYQSNQSGYYKSEKLKSVIELSLDYWVRNDFICDNWWHNQIGTPDNLVKVMLLMGNELSKDLIDKTQPIINRANLDASGARPSGDRIKIAGIMAKNLLFINDTENFDKVIKIIEGEIKFSTGRGMQYDYSFHHRIDRVNNTLSYGLGYADAFVEWAYYVAGTGYSFSDEKINHLIDYYLDGICKTMVYGKYPDAGAKNRSISRKGALRQHSINTAEKLLITSDYREKELKEIVEIRKNNIKPTLSHATFFWHSEHFTYQRPDFFTSVRMFSSRNNNMEVPYNSEGLLNHHRGDGTNHISMTGDEYFDIWPVFDYQKIPGATIMQKPELPSENQIRKAGKTDFVGAVTDGKYGAAAFDFQSPHDPLRARKAWFFFDTEYVCLGAGIDCSKKLSVVTTLNQCLLRDKVVTGKKGITTELNRGEHILKDVEWVFHDGIGYIFTQPTDVFLNNNSVSGSWYRINRQTDSPREEVRKDVFKLWLSHGERPHNDTYQYIVVPATSEAEMASRKVNPGVEILANTPDIQAVKQYELGIYQIVFYKPGKIRISDKIMLSCESPAIVMIKTKEDDVTQISVSDPNRNLSKLRLTVTSKIENSGMGFKSLWDEKKMVSEITIDLPQNVYAGKSVTIL